MDVIHNIMMGFGVALDPMNLLFCFAGVLTGTLVGVLPGFGPTAAISLLLPLTFKLGPIPGIIMLSGIYYGAMYGGSTTSILVNIPGEAASVVTCLDGYQMARQGKAGPALGMSAFGSFIAGTFGVVLLMLLAPPLAEMALKFGPPEYFALMILGLTLLIFLSSGPIAKALLMAGLGLFLGTVGIDNMTGNARFTFGSMDLLDGIGLVPVVMGLFGIGEVLYNLERPIKRVIFQTTIGRLLPSAQDWWDCRWALVRGSLIGFFLGVLPGGGVVIASFAAYAIEKRFSKHPEKFGTGAIEGVAAPESANNSAAAGAFIPLLSLGIPGNAVTAILLGALVIHGIQPGPMMITEHADLFWGVVTSMYIGNAMLLILNLPLIGLWVKALKLPYSILFPLICLFCMIGAYSLNNRAADMLIMTFFGVMGYLMRKFKYEAAPLVLALVLVPMMEAALRRSLLLSNGSPLIFVTRPLSTFIFIAVIVMILFSLVPALKKKRGKLDQILEEGEDD